MIAAHLEQTIDIWGSRCRNAAGEFLPPEECAFDPSKAPPPGAREKELPTDVFKVKFSQAEFLLSVDALQLMVELANKTNKTELGFLLREGADGVLRPGRRCQGGSCSIYLTDEPGYSHLGRFHTHPGFRSYSDSQSTRVGETFSVGDLCNVRSGTFHSVSNRFSPHITFAVLRPGRRQLTCEGIERAGYPYIHPDTPKLMAYDIKTNYPFSPNIGKAFEYVRVPKSAIPTPEPKGRKRAKSSQVFSSLEAKMGQVELMGHRPPPEPECFDKHGHRLSASKCAVHGILPACTAQQVRLVESCIQQLKTSGDTQVNPWAMCQASVGCRQPSSYLSDGFGHNLPLAEQVDRIVKGAGLV